MAVPRNASVRRDPTRILPKDKTFSMQFRRRQTAAPRYARLSILVKDFAGCPDRGVANTEWSGVAT
jgi:hypothetical protein